MGTVPRWPRKKGGTGSSLSAEGDFTVRWTYDTGHGPVSSPVIDDEGNIFFSSDALYSVSPQGELNWRSSDLGPTTSTPAIGDSIYLGGGYGKNLISISGGAEQWSVDNYTSAFDSDPLLAEDGTIYIISGSPDQALHAFDGDGNEIWNFSTMSQKPSSPTLAVDGSILYGIDFFSFPCIPTVH